jgi:large subunit ribosomal protein L17
MRHRKAGKQLSRNSAHRRAMLRNMVTSLFKSETIETTETKAKVLRPLAEKMITLAKRGDLHARRQALAFMKEKRVTHKLFEELKAQYVERQGGYVRIIKKGVRKGDGAPLSIVQLIHTVEEEKPGKKKGKKAGPVKGKAKKPEKEKKVKKKEEKPARAMKRKKTESESVAPQEKTESAPGGEDSEKS